MATEMGIMPTIESTKADLKQLTDAAKYEKMDEFTQKRVDVLLARLATLMGVNTDE